MTRGVRWCLVGSLVLVALAGCSRGWLAQREPWRREAEEQCLKTGAVREGAGVALLKPIDGPGICGADYPLKVAALGEGAMLGYADELRPPGSIPGAGPAPRPAPAYSPIPTYRRVVPEPDPRLPAPDDDAPDSRGPLSLSPPGVEPPPGDVPGAYTPPLPDYGARRGSMRAVEPPPSRPAVERLPYPPSYPPHGERVPVGPPRAPPVTGAVSAAVTPPATLACPVVSALDRWVSEAVQPAAQRWFGQPVTEIRQISAYSCRGMNGNPRARISEHAFGNALDIAGFVLADGRTVTVKGGWRGSPEEQGFLRDVQGAACEQFATVLAPGSNVYHYDHIHVDLMRRASGRHVCQPAAVPGEVVAARARERGGYARRDPSFTGSIGSRRPRRDRLPDAPFGDELDLPKAVAGED